VDSPEILPRLQPDPLIRKVEGPFPACMATLQEAGPFDAILVYSVLQCVFAEASLARFVDSALMRLDGAAGAMLSGDIPNASTRNRFFDRDAWCVHHALHHEGKPVPAYRLNVPELGEIGGAVVLGIVAPASRPSCCREAWAFPWPIAAKTS